MLIKMSNENRPLYSVPLPPQFEYFIRIYPI